MSTSSVVTGTDFVCVATRDYEAAKRFYGEVLGLPFSKPWGKRPAGEFEAGSLTLAVMQSDAFGAEFTPAAGIALRVDDVAAARRELESRGVEFRGDIVDSGVCHQASGPVAERRLAPARAAAPVRSGSSGPSSSSGPGRWPLGIVRLRLVRLLLVRLGLVRVGLVLADERPDRTERAVAVRWDKALRRSSRRLHESQAADPNDDGALLGAAP